MAVSSDNRYMRKIVVGVDESAEAIAALSWALDNAAADDTVLIIHAWQMPTYEAMDPMMYDPSEIRVWRQASG